MNDRMKESCLEAGLEYDYYIFGDSAYKVDTHIRSYVNVTTQEERRWNGAMKHVRISIEWNYMVTATLFPYVGNEAKLKILKSPGLVSRVYIVTTILRNFYSCLYGNQSSIFFEYIFPQIFLEKYANQEDLN